MPTCGTSHFAHRHKGRKECGMREEEGGRCRRRHIFSQSFKVDRSLHAKLLNCTKQTHISHTCSFLTHLKTPTLLSPERGILILPCLVTDDIYCDSWIEMNQRTQCNGKPVFFLHANTLHFILKAFKCMNVCVCKCLCGINELQ